MQQKNTILEAYESLENLQTKVREEIQDGCSISTASFYRKIKDPLKFSKIELEFIKSVFEKYNINLLID